MGGNRCTLAGWMPRLPASPYVSLLDSVTLSRNGRRLALAGRMMSYHTTPYVSLWDSVTLSRKKCHLALTGRTPHLGFTPHVSRMAVASHRSGPMRSRGKHVCDPGGHDVCAMLHAVIKLAGAFWAQRGARAPATSDCGRRTRGEGCNYGKKSKHSGW